MRRLVAHWWTAHPAVRNHDQLTLGERAADRMRLGMGSWAFVGSAVLFLAIWMTYNAVTGAPFDAYPFILLNLVLSCLAALQGAILLIAAKRSDQISAELAGDDHAKLCQLIEEAAEIRDALAQIRNALVAGAPGGGQ